MRFSPGSPIRVIRSNIYLLTGIVSIRVEKGQLQIGAGVFDDVENILLTKASMGKGSRLVILGHSGSITLNALRWLYDIGSSVIQLDYDGSIILASSPSGLDFPTMRRSQALTAGRSFGLQLAKFLISRKMKEQMDLCREKGNIESADSIFSLIETGIIECKSISEIRALESQVASIYWSTWSDVPLSFARKDRRRVPSDWLTFGNRTSSITRSSRKAATPANAMLNYLYALLEVESRLASLTMGLDPGIGIMHHDQRNRDSLALDLMEPARPVVDAWLYDLIMHRTFARSDFFETSEGQVMLTKHLAGELAATMPLWRGVVGPIVEWMAHNLQSQSHAYKKGDDGGVPTKLTQSKRSRGREMPGSCPECGKPVQGNNRLCSSTCFNSYSQNVIIPNFKMAGVSKLAAIRKSGHDPAHGGKAAEKRGASNRRRADERKTWEAAHSPDDLLKEQERFRTEVFPTLAEYSITQIAKTTGLTPRYASLIRSGKVVPHPVHNAKLMELTRSVPANG